MEKEEDKVNELDQLAQEASAEMVAETQIKSDLHGKGVKKVVGLLVRYLLPLVFTVLLVWYMFRKIDFSTMISRLSEGVDYWWILLGMGINTLSHVVRAARWRIQLRSLGIRPPFMALCCSVFGCYALNLVFPRLGEVWRCSYISSRQKAPFTTVLGSMVADRICDTLMVLLLLVFTLIVAREGIQMFLSEHAAGQDILDLIQNPLVWCIAFGCLVIGFGIVFFFRHTSIVQKLWKWLRELWEGFSVIWKMDGRIMFILLSFGIWACYFFSLYVAFFAFPFTRELCTGSSGLAFGLVPCLVAFVLSSIGMAVPTNGGLGAWNVAVIFGLNVYHISDPDGTLFSMVQWSATTVMLILLGIYTMIYIAISKPSKKPVSAI